MNPIFKRNDWTYLLKRKMNKEDVYGEGHKLFLYKGKQSPCTRSNIAIADYSGVYPHETNDGVLWVNLDTPMILTDRGEVKIHLLEILDDGYVKECSTISDLKTAFAIHEYAGLEIIYNSTHKISFKKITE